MSYLEEVHRSLIHLLPAEQARVAMWLRPGDEPLGIEERALDYGSAREPRRLSVEEYLAIEEKSPERHEYVDGVMYAMSGVSEAHSFIAGNIYAALHAHVRGGPCRVHMADFKLRIEINHNDLFYYPRHHGRLRP